MTQEPKTGLGKIKIEASSARVPSNYPPPTHDLIWYWTGHYARSTTAALPKCYRCSIIVLLIPWRRIQSNFCTKGMGPSHSCRHFVSDHADLWREAGLNKSARNGLLHQLNPFVKAAKLLPNHDPLVYLLFNYPTMPSPPFRCYGALKEDRGFPQ